MMLKGSKVVLRPVKRSDIQYFVVWFNDLEVTQYIGRSLPMTEMAEEKWVEGLAADNTRVNLVIEAVRPEGSLPIGTIGFEMINSIDRQANFGIVIGNKDFWSQGSGTEAAGLFIEYAFNQMNLNRINSCVYDFNLRSRRMHLKLGFKEEGRRRQAKYVNGEYHDVIDFGLLKSEWKSGLSGRNEKGED